MICGNGPDYGSHPGSLKRFQPTVRTGCFMGVARSWRVRYGFCPNYGPLYGTRKTIEPLRVWIMDVFKGRGQIFNRMFYGFTLSWPYGSHYEFILSIKLLVLLYPFYCSTILHYATAVSLTMIDHDTVPPLFLVTHLGINVTCSDFWSCIVSATSLNLGASCPQPHFYLLLFRCLLLVSSMGVRGLLRHCHLLDSSHTWRPLTRTCFLAVSLRLYTAVDIFLPFL
jgi:hypothetical protein